MNNLVKIYQETKNASLYGYTANNGKNYRIPRATINSMKNNQLYWENSRPIPFPDNTSNRHSFGGVKVYPGDTLTVSKMLQESPENYKVIALNMASDVHPGGGVEHGARAQEEALFRCSNYNQALTAQSLGLPNGYYIHPFGAIYTPNVQIIRDNNTFEFIEPYSLDFIAAAAYNRGKRFTAPRNPAQYREGVKEKFRTVLRMAHVTGHDCIVLSAWGCGAFGNDPNLVATCFREIFVEIEFVGMFKHIAFAIINDHNGTHNFQIFKKFLDGIHWTRRTYRAPKWDSLIRMATVAVDKNNQVLPEYDERDEFDKRKKPITEYSSTYTPI